ncbi:MAG: hypothetical protein VKJ44_09740 [Synechococcus sp.]|nr:hypothetical protein [Synechococcus sp.]
MAAICPRRRAWAPVARLRAGLGSALLSGLLAWSGAAALPPVRAATPTSAQLQALEAALNGRDPAALQALLQPGPGLNPTLLERRWSALRQQFSDARWQLSPGAPTQAGQPTVTLSVVGSRSEAGTTYRLSAEQQLELHSDGQRIQAQNLLREQTILRSGDADLPVSVLIPDAVLTGQRYDVDVIFDDPLDGAVVAGGVQALTAQQVAAMESPPLEFSVLGGGGLFKTVQAPFLPGSQTWAVLLIHPRGVVSATKRVRVVNDRAGLLP